MNISKHRFKNKEGVELSAVLELPFNQESHNFVLFAHCFTCNKNFLAVKNIARALTANGFGVLRFDFTGLGESEGEFADTNFSGNVDDLLAAADFLKKEYKAPSLLVGHSLGGAAVLFAAQQSSSIKAVATIAAPSSPQHVKHLLKSNLEEIEKNGYSKVNLGGRDFTIKAQFLQDLDTKKLKDVVREMEKSILVMHSPQDTIVGIKNAEEIYLAARHPKSFISLDGADHLLTNKSDSKYAGEVIAAWALRYLNVPEKEKLSSKHQVMANLGNEGFTTQIKAGDHFLTSDEPESIGGSNFGPTPYELLSASLAACTSMTIQMYARRKKWPLKDVETHVNHDKEHAEDCNNCERNSSKIDIFKREIVLEGDLDSKQQEKLLEIANKCPVHRTLHNDIKITTRLLTS
ncbi:alpha/beta fold hydrolase [Salinimicrobium sp. GXAS 041]|uniref:bifunctional alpha/beta hydrolase/OsmC family protein n=1 Tax=Salinimicrobium sp. GXAS 041 TaxID=3400806 RepID=UPI003C758F66